MLELLRQIRREWQRKQTRLWLVVCLLGLAFVAQQGWVRAYDAMDLPWYVVPSRMWLDGINPYASTREQFEQYSPRPYRYWHHYGYLPHTLPIMAPFSLLSWQTLLKVWWCLSFVMMVFGLVWLVQLTAASWSAAAKLCFIGLACQTRLVQHVATLGQLSLVEFGLMMAVLHTMLARKHAAAGILLGVASIKFSSVIPLYFLALWRREWRLLAWMSLVIAVGTAIACLQAGGFSMLTAAPASMRAFTAELRGEAPNAHMLSLDHLWRAVAGETKLAGILTLISQIAVLGATLWSLRGWPRHSLNWPLASLTLFSLIVIYHQLYDGIFLWIPLIVALEWRRRSGRWSVPVAALLAACLVDLVVFGVVNVSYRYEDILRGMGPLRMFVPINVWLTAAAFIASLLAMRQARAAETSAQAPGS